MTIFHNGILFLKKLPMHLPRPQILGVCLDADRYINLRLDLITRGNSASGSKKGTFFFSTAI